MWWNTRRDNCGNFNCTFSDTIHGTFTKAFKTTNICKRPAYTLILPKAVCNKLRQNSNKYQCTRFIRFWQKQQTEETDWAGLSQKSSHEFRIWNSRPFRHLTTTKGSRFRDVLVQTSGVNDFTEAKIINEERLPNSTKTHTIKFQKNLTTVQKYSFPRVSRARN